MSEVRQTIEINIYDFFLKRKREKAMLHNVPMRNIKDQNIRDTDMNSELPVNFAF